MKISKNLAAFLFLLGIFCSAAALGQDDRLPDLDSGTKEHRFDPATDVLPETDLKVTKPIVAPRDSVSAKPSIKKAEGKPKPEENTSVLSFNFLYYLLERFKLSDIVD